MKKLIQVSIIVVLAFVLLQAVAAPPMAFAGATYTTVGQSTGSPAVASVSNVQVAICLTSRNCVTPNVGWNS